MEYPFLGSSGLQVSVLSLGVWVTYGERGDEDVDDACMITARKAGVNFFDSAEA